MYFTEVNGTLAAANWWLTPIPQSSTMRVPLISIKLAGLDRPISTRGPPFVPRKTIRVRAFASDCACAGGNFIIEPRVPNIEIFRSRRRCSIYFSPPSETHRQLNLVSRLKPSAQQIVLFPALPACSPACSDEIASIILPGDFSQTESCLRSRPGISPCRPRVIRGIALSHYSTLAFALSASHKRATASLGVLPKKLSR